MDFKSMLEQLSQLSEATQETGKGRIHKAEPGGYGRKFDTDEEGEEKKEKKAEAPKKRGRPPKTGEHSKEEQKKQAERSKAGKELQSYIVGNIPKSHAKTKGTVVKGKAQSADQKEGGDKKKKSVKEWVEEIEQKYIAEATPGQQLQVKPMPGAAQLQDPATQKVIATGPADKIKALQGSVAKGEVTMTGGKEEMSEEQLDELSSQLAYRAGDAADKQAKKLQTLLPQAAQMYRDKVKKFDAYAKAASDREDYAHTLKLSGMSPAMIRKMQAQKDTQMTEEGGEKWIQKAIKHPGALRKKLHAKPGEPIPAGKLEKATHSKDATTARQARLAQTLRGLGEGEIPHESGVDNIGAGLGAGRSQTTLETKAKDLPGKQDKLDVAEPKGKLDAKDFAKLRSKKKVNESMHKHSAARLMGKAHALAKEGYNCRYEDVEEAKCYHEGYKEGLDECYGQMPIVGLVKESDPIPATTAGMASQAQKSAAAQFSPEMHDQIKNATPQQLDAMAQNFAGPGSSYAMYEYELKMLQRAQAELKGLAEDEFGEGNLFTGNLAKARAAGKSHADLDGDGDMEKVTEFGMAFETWDKELNSLLTESEEVSEGMTVSISKGQQGSPDSVSVSAQDGEADALLGLIKQAGLGLFGDEGSHIGAGADNQLMSKPGGIDVVGDHDGMMSLIKKVVGGGAEGSSDYEDEEGGHEEHGEEEHEHTDEETCNECGYMESKCGCDKEQVEEVESEDQMAYEVAEDNPPDSGAAETTADENAEAAEDEALAKADELNEWANQAGKGPGKGTDASFEQDIEFMTKFIAGGLNKPKSTGQTTIPVIAGQDTRMEDPMAWARLAGIKK